MNLGGPLTIHRHGIFVCTYFTEDSSVGTGYKKIGFGFAFDCVES